MVGFPGHPADSGVGESVGSCNLVGKDSSYFTRPVLTIKRDPPDIRQNQCPVHLFYPGSLIWSQFGSGSRVILLKEKIVLEKKIRGFKQNKEAKIRILPKHENCKQNLIDFFNFSSSKTLITLNYTFYEKSLHAPTKIFDFL